MKTTLFLCIFVASALATEKVNVTVYYESLCKDSRKFLTAQLYPALQDNKLDEFVNLKLIPFGKSTQQLQNDTWEFTCHHGPNECTGNKVHACALKIIDGGTDRNTRKPTVGFITCLMRHSNETHPAMPIDDCAKTQQISRGAEIRDCSSAGEASALLSGYGNATQELQPRLKSVPTIVFNGVYNGDDSAQAQSNFTTVLCKYIRGDKPAICQNNGAGPHYVSSVVLIAAAYLLKHVF